MGPSTKTLAPVTSTNGPKPSKSTVSLTACAISDLPFKSPLLRQPPNDCESLPPPYRPRRQSHRPPDGGLAGAVPPASFVLAHRTTAMGGNRAFAPVFLWWVRRCSPRTPIRKPSAFPALWRVGARLGFSSRTTV